ncbi:MAG: AmmeMemoRadiSam system protein A [Parcubacteria group bacterium]|jgi:AmmeMemoRadiSam system protein A
MNYHVQLAKSAIEEYVRSEKIIDVPENLPAEFYKKNGGVFVTISGGEGLRGCVGTYSPAYASLAEEIIMNAVAACSHDDRFSPISPEELPELSLEVSLLNSPRKISGLLELDPKKYGVIVKCPDGRCGLLLPDLQGVDNVERQFSIACQKGRISPDDGKEMEIWRFEVKKYK